MIVIRTMVLDLVSAKHSSCKVLAESSGFWAIWGFGWGFFASGLKKTLLINTYLVVSLCTKFCASLVLVWYSEIPTLVVFGGIKTENTCYTIVYYVIWILIPPFFVAEIVTETLWLPRQHFMLSQSPPSGY